MVSGRCSSTAVLFGVTIPCPCPRGEFDVQLGLGGENNIDVECKVCAHPVSEHEDASPAPAQDSMSQSQGMASSSVQLHLR